MPMKFNITRRRGKAKRKLEEKRKEVMRKMVNSYSEDFDVKMSVIQELIPLGLKAVSEALQQEVNQLAGERYGRRGSRDRWGSQNGSVYLRDQKFGIKVPRVRDVEANEEVGLETYQRLQKPFDDDGGSLKRLLHGLSTRKYHESSALAAEAFGISASSLSKRFKRGSAKKLKELQTRSLNSYDIVAIFIDAKRYAEDGLIVALGVTVDGTKIVLGVEHIHSENAKAIEQWMDKLIERGLRFEEGILFIIDGSKGIRKALERRFAAYALCQRCRWHKQENIVAYLDDAQQVLFRRRLQEAYAKTTYKEALAELQKIHQQLERINSSAANSLNEGLEETLTLHQLGLSPELTKSLSTTNCLESVMSLLGQYTDKVDRWHNGNQILRWTATGLLDIEPRLNKIQGARYLPVLKYKLKGIVRQRLQKDSGEKNIAMTEVSSVEPVCDR